MNIDLDDIMQKVIRKMYGGKIKPGQPDPAIVKATADELWKAILKGWNTDPSSARFGSQEQRLLVQLRFNKDITSIFKHHHSSLAMARELFDSSGKLRSFKEFQMAVKTQVDQKYNKQWLQTEYNTALASAQQARKWTIYQSRGGSITYVAVIDARTRPDHHDWNGVTLPVSHEWWNSHYPPNGFNCRCTTRWAGHEADDVLPKSNEEIPAQFQNNVGKTGQAFTDALPYFTVDGAFAAQAANLFGFKPIINLAKFEANLKLFESLQVNPNYTQAFTDNLSGGYIFSHNLADKKYLQENLKAAKRMAINGDAVIIREHLQGVSNPEYLINGNLLSDLKTPVKKTSSAILTAFKEADKRQGLSHLVLNADGYTLSALVDGLTRGFRNRINIQSLKILYGNKVIEITRDQFYSGKIKEEIMQAL